MEFIMSDQGPVKEHLTNRSALHKLGPAMERRTIARELTIEGTGLHGGGKTMLLLRPGSDGIVFISSGRRIPATPTSVVETRLNTTIGDGTAQVSTIEHLMSALYGLMITDCEIEIKGNEVPAMDGSALPFVRFLEDAGTWPIGRSCNPIRISSVFRCENGDAWIEARPGAFSLTYEIDFPDPAIGFQRYSYTGNDYVAEIAPARTFGRIKDVEMMRSAGLARGGGLHNAVVVDHDSIINPEGLRFPDECVRHKILDALGDLWMLGAPLVAQISASKARHALHIDLARKIFETLQHNSQE
jgi:UDP-3-O-[3-hydroxymyristoyl] N-acetylglucosamine deacetylase